ncbi:MAG: adenosylmethionine decarboxylase [Burkholderiales bacterium]|jgi:S-adenosylmethionine decarboxylase
MRNLKLKQVLPVDTETETLQKFSMADNGLRLASDNALSSASSSPALHSVKETPGLHVMGDLYDVQCADRFLLDADLLRSHCLKLVEEAGLSSVGDFFHQFDGAGGVTGMVVLAESHMSIHTWPEKRYVTVDVYVCSYTQDNRPRARQLYQSLLDTFQPERESVHSVERL